MNTVRPSIRLKRTANNLIARNWRMEPMFEVIVPGKPGFTQHTCRLSKAFDYAVRIAKLFPGETK